MLSAVSILPIVYDIIIVNIIYNTIIIPNTNIIHNTIIIPNIPVSFITLLWWWTVDNENYIVCMQSCHWPPQSYEECIAEYCSF